MHKPTVMAHAAILAVVTCLTAGPEVVAAGTESLTVGLTEAVRAAQSRYPGARAAALQVERARNVRRQAEQARILPRLGLEAQTGLVPAARGDIFDSPDDADKVANLGPYYRFGVGFMQPIFTFGKISSAIDVARGAVTVQEEDRQRQLNRIGLAAAEAYWSIVATDAGREVVQELKGMYDDFVERVRGQVEDPDSRTDAADLYEAESLQFAVQQRYREVFDQGDVARRGLQVLRDTDPARTIEVAPQVPPRVELAPADLGAMVAYALDHDPAVRAAREAVGVAEAAVRLADSRWRPDLLLRGGVQWSHASHRTNQSNPFVYDNFNYFRLGASLDLRWDLNYRRHDLRSQRERIDRDLARAREELVAGQVRVEVETAFRELLTSDALVDVALESRQSGRAWLLGAVDHWELGIGSLSRVVRAYERFFLTQEQVILNELRRNLALARLADELGSLDLYLQWMADGRVTVP
jgi:outer membrane protein TolC